MRKIFSMALMILSVALLVACSDRKISDDTFNVIFYTGQQASYVDTYFDVKEGSMIEEPEAPTRPNFAFEGWFKDVNYSSEWNFEGDEVSSSIVLYAKWRSQDYTVQYVIIDELGEEFLDPTAVFNEFTASDNLYLPKVKRPGGVFKGWSLVPQSEYTLDMPLYSVTRALPLSEIYDYTLYPIFQNSKFLFQFRSNIAGVANPAPKTNVEYGVVIDFLPQLADTATHRFLGWYSSNGTSTNNWGIKVENGDYNTFTNAVTLYGRWELKN